MVNSNNPAHYILITVGIIIGMAGVLLRFVIDSTIIDIISNILLVIGTIICFKAVFAVLKG